MTAVCFYTLRTVTGGFGTSDPDRPDSLALAGAEKGGFAVDELNTRARGPEFAVVQAFPGDARTRLTLPAPRRRVRRPDGRSARSRYRDRSRCAPRSRARRGGGLRGPRTGGPSQALDIAAQWMAQCFNADDSDHSRSTTAGACGRLASDVGPKTVTTLLGPVTLQRAYCHCDACRQRGVSARPSPGFAR